MGCCCSPPSNTWTDRPDSLFAIDQTKLEGAKFARLLAQKVLFNFPRVIAQHIIAFAEAPRYKWATNPVDPPNSITVQGNKVTCADPSTWFKIISTRSIVSAPRRWKILIEFDAERQGWIQVGVTLSQPFNKNLQTSGWALGSRSDVFGSIVQQKRDDDRHRYPIDAYDRSTPNGTSKSQRKAETLKCIILVDIYGSNQNPRDYQWLRLRALGNDLEPDRDLLLPLQYNTSLQPPEKHFYPCVVVAGGVTATIY